jgi:class 3 adenylate cyclase
VSSSGLITILFTDLVGSTDLASDIGDSAADELRRAHFAHLREAVAATGGTEIKTIGDALMVTYTGAADAVAGAVAMQRAVERQNRGLDGRPLEMRVGVSAGDATFEDGDWFGTPVVEAARLCAEAAGGQILVSDLVRALAGSRSEFGIQPLGTRELKGLPEPLAVCEVTWDAPRDETIVALPTFVDTASAFPFAGRADERERLMIAWKESAEGERRVVLVSGEPGIGKTRLVSEVVREAHERGATILWGRCDEELGIPYEPFAEALRQYAAAVPAEQLRAELGALGGELTRMLPELSARVPGLADPVQTEPETERHRLFEAVTDLLAEVSQNAPVILVLDDMHWSDKPSLLLLRHIVRAATPMRVLVLATYRDTDLDRSHPLSDVLADLRRQPGVERLDLDGLDGAEVAEFMAAAAGHELDAAGVELARAVHGETQGNPFFAGEVLRHLAESGAIVERDGRWTSDMTLDEVGIPEGIREVVSRRLSRLSDSANAALAVAAVIGATFDLSTIEAAGGPAGDELFDALDEATQASIIREIPDTFGRYTFAHALVRSSLYEELTTNRRVRMHWKVGEAIEARHAHDLDAHLDELAHHFGEGALAGDPLKAVEFGRRAGESANAELAFETAARHFDHALGALELVDQPDPLVRCDLHLALAEALYNGTDDRRREAAFTAAASARALGDGERLARAVLVLASGSMPQAVGFVDDAFVALLEEALDAVGPQDSGLRARLLSGLACELQWGPEVERRMRVGREALAMARITRDPEALSAVLAAGWALVDGSVPFVEEIRRLNDEAETVARDQQDPVALVRALRGQMFNAACRGRKDEFEERLAASARIVDGLRRPIFTWAARNDAAAFAALAGDLDRADQLAVEAAELGQRTGVPEGSVMGSMGALLYMIRFAQGRVGELVPILTGLVDSQPGAPVWRVALAGALVESDEVDDARVHFDWLANDDCANVPPDVEFPVTICGLARIAFLVRPTEQVLHSLRERLTPFAGTFNWSGVTVTDPNDLGLAMVNATLRRDDEADGYFTDVIALCERAGAAAYLARCHFDWARVRVDRGDTAGARGQAEIALEMSTALGMTGPHGVVARSRAMLDEI